MVKEEKNGKRSTVRAPVSIIQQTMAALSINQAELADRIGVSTTAISHWIRTGHTSKLAAVACTGLMAARKKNPDQVSMLVCLVNGDKVESVQSVLRALGATVQKMELP